MRTLVLAHGDGRRWQDRAGRPYLGVAKQLVEIDGESLLHRVVRLVRERGIDDVVIVAPDARFDVDGAERVELTDAWPVPCDMSKFLATRHLWSDAARTVILWGDVFYTEAAMDTILHHDDEAYHVFRRPGPSRTTGHEWDESFAVSFGPHEHDRVARAAQRVADALRRHLIRDSHIRTHYAEMVGARYKLLRDRAAVKRVAIGPAQTHIDDFTDDIDSPREWRSFVGRYYAKRSEPLVVVRPSMPEGCDPTVLGAAIRRWERLGVRAVVGTQTISGSQAIAECNEVIGDALAASPHDGVVLVDSLALIQASQFWAGCHLAHQRAGAAALFDVVRVLTRRETRSWIMEGCFDLQPHKQRARGIEACDRVSGALVVTRETWERLGGLDTRCASIEDAEARIAQLASERHSEMPRVEGELALLATPALRRALQSAQTAASVEDDPSSDLRAVARVR